MQYSQAGKLCYENLLQDAICRTTLETEHDCFTVWYGDSLEEDVVYGCVSRIDEI